MATPKCEYCRSASAPSTPEDSVMTAQYDFVDVDGNWRYGCITHWQKHRASRQLGVGHAMHLGKGIEPPPRSPGYEAPPLGVLAKPQVRAQLIRPEPAARLTAVAAPNGAPRPPREPKPKLPKIFTDMEAKSEIKGDPRPGSVLAVTLDLIRVNGGATLDEINTAIGPKHDALKLLQWANENKGYGWKQDPETKKISTVFYGK